MYLSFFTRCRRTQGLFIRPIGVLNWPSISDTLPVRPLLRGARSTRSRKLDDDKLDPAKGGYPPRQVAENKISSIYSETGKKRPLKASLRPKQCVPNSSG